MGGKAIREFSGLGPKSEAMLARAGISSFEQLRTIGSVRAFALVRRTGMNPSLNLLWGLESAISGIPWQAIARQNRLPLLMELEEIENDLEKMPSGFKS
jgi:DNA transformation protein and related proteins